jgi:hypothetical protein
MFMTIRHFYKIISLSVVALLVITTEAHAQTLGRVIFNTAVSFHYVPILLQSVAYISGIFLAASGVFKFKDHVDHPSQHPLSAGVKRFLAGGMMLTAPYMMRVLRGTLFNVSNQPLAKTDHHPVSVVAGGGMDQMIYNLVADISGPMSYLLTVFTYLAAICLLLVAISRLTKTAQEGPRGPAGTGTIVTFLVAGALFSSGSMLGSFSSSLFGNSGIVSTFASISPSIISNTADAARLASMLEALMTFIMIVGCISFIRGWLVLKSFADGNQNSTLAQAMTFLFGGAVAINLGPMVNVLENTLGIGGITFS